jgi:DNA repair protein RecN (Recombination protein N)
MLSNLLIKNYALIEELELSPDSHFNIITGETGAGKSILLGAIGLLLGNRADTKALYNPDQKCVVEGVFDVKGYALDSLFEEEELDYSDQCDIRREISPSGKSRAFVNDTPVNLETLRRVTGQLMDIHSQHDSILLGSSLAQLQIVDAYAANEPLRERYKSGYRTYQRLRSAFLKLEADAARIKKEFDYHNFLFQELESADVKSGEQESLEAELLVLENAAEIKERLGIAYDYLESSESSLVDQLKGAFSSISQLSRLVPEYAQLCDRIQSCAVELKDLVDEIEKEADKVEVDDERAGIVKERLDMIYKLQQKHQVKSIDELLDIKRGLEQLVNQALNLDAELENGRQKMDEAKSRTQNAALELSQTRKNVIGSVEEKIRTWLAELGMPNAVLTIENTTTGLTPEGIDQISFLFSANKGIAPQELKSVASGGEFSRLTLVIKYILAEKKKLPTIIFDEIDTGVSGQVAIKMGEMIQRMAKNHQVIAITHLHQIASKGNAHYFVFKDETKDRTVSRMRKLDVDERVWEIAQMIGGSHPSELIINNARELLAQNQDSSGLRVP